MPDLPPGTMEVRLLVVAIVDLASAELADALLASGNWPVAVTQVVADEVRSNLESVSYVAQITVNPFGIPRRDL